MRFEASLGNLCTGDRSLALLVTTESSTRDTRLVGLMVALKIYSKGTTVAGELQGRINHSRFLTVSLSNRRVR